jgi:hypothetical protein
MKQFLKFISIGILAFTLSCTTQNKDQWEKVLPADLSELSPEDFKNDELDMPYYLAHFHRVANAVVEKGKNKGFIDISVWRGQDDNKPYNARVMEGILSLVYFYCTDRPWNPYYNSSRVKKRIEAAMQYWCNMQSETGQFSEYGEEEWNLAATAFATKFMGESLWLLTNRKPGIDTIIYKRALQTDRKAIHEVLTNEDLYEFGKSFSNQFTNVWPGALAYLDIKEDPEIDSLFTKVLLKSRLDFQSPAGYFYEKDGPDWGYNLGTHENNLMMAWHYLKDTKYAYVIKDKVENFYDWLSYNAVPESGTNNNLYFLNKPVETRQSKIAFESQGASVFQGLPLGKPVEITRPFLDTRNTLEAQYKKRRKELENNWPEVEPLEVGDFTAFSPYAFLHRRVEKWYPTREQKQTAIQSLPYKNNASFIHQRMDKRVPTVYTYIKKPGYYAIFNSGKRAVERQRFGIGIIWTSEAEILLQGQTGTDAEAWGTFDNQLAEAQDLPVNFSIDGETVDPTVGKNDLINGRLQVSYKLANNGNKKVVFKNREISVDIESSGKFREYLPFVLNGDDKMEIQSNKIIIDKNEQTVVVHFPEQFDVQINTGDLSVYEERQLWPRIKEPKEFRLEVCAISARDNLTYRIEF